jgi:hypothetical protein
MSMMLAISPLDVCAMLCFVLCMQPYRQFATILSHSCNNYVPSSDHDCPVDVCFMLCSVLHVQPSWHLATILSHSRNISVPLSLECVCHVVPCPVYAAFLASRNKPSVDKQLFQQGANGWRGRGGGRRRNVMAADRQVCELEGGAGCYCAMGLRLTGRCVMGGGSSSLAAMRSPTATSPAPPEPAQRGFSQFWKQAGADRKM